MKAYDETSISSSESMTDLKREVAKFRDSETQSGQYIAELEARLARSDESILALQRTVETLEKETERRRDEAELLQSRLDALRQDGENWRSDLEERERKVRELEEKMEQWERKKKDAGDARTRLGGVAQEVASARRSLEVDIATAKDIASSKSARRSIEVDLASGTVSPAADTPSSAATLNGDDQPSDSEGTVAPDPDSLENQFLSLQQTHTATLSDLSSVTSKYRDALREISDLAAQIQEAKLSNPSIAESESPAEDKPVEMPQIRRRMTSGRLRESGEQYNSAGRRLFFRQAASTESLHSR